MTGHGPFIAVDWGTTNRRAWRLSAAGQVEDMVADAAGITATPADGFDRAVADLRARLGDWPMLLGGMIGSDRGWRQVPYVPCPADCGAIAAAITWIDPRTGIVPGVCQPGADAPDVMRGEEVQIIGALASGAMGGDALACLPGTHAKWVRVRGGQIATFSTWMTGEVFALLRRHSILAPLLGASAVPGAAFAAGVAASAQGDPLAGLFRLRAAAALDAAMDDAASYASGLLIGAEVRGALALWPQEAGAAPCVIGHRDLHALYAAALAELGVEARAVDGEAAFCAGITALRGAAA